MIYFVQYKRDHDHSIYYAKLEGLPAGLAWRQLQEQFDPRYYYNSLQFFAVSGEIKYIQGE